MKIVIIQKSINELDITPYLDKAASRGADILCFGELALSGCLYNGGRGMEVDRIRQLTANYPMAVMFGFPSVRSGRLYNSYAYIADNQAQIYDKINLFEPMGENKVFTPGVEPMLVTSRFGKLGTLICFDLRFEEPFEILKSKGAQYVFVPAAWPRVRVADWKKLLVQRAVDNGYYIIGINSVGDDGTNEFGGSSMVVDPAGKILAEADEITPTILEVEI
ncbi:MAG: hypothetical protein P1R58_10575 [bacterium]|nr:hypothetical protein [bacterium]